MESVLRRTIQIYHFLLNSSHAVKHTGLQILILIDHFGKLDIISDIFYSFFSVSSPKYNDFVYLVFEFSDVLPDFFYFLEIGAFINVGTPVDLVASHIFLSKDSLEGLHLFQFRFHLVKESRFIDLGSFAGLINV